MRKSPAVVLRTDNQVPCPYPSLLLTVHFKHMILVRTLPAVLRCKMTINPGAIVSIAHELLSRRSEDLCRPASSVQSVKLFCAIS